MKRNLLTIAVIAGIAVSGLVLARADAGNCAGGGWHGHGRAGFGFERMTKSLNLTSDQQAKVQPIIDQAKPQIVAIHQDAMQKTKAVMDDTMSKIRPLLTPEQQKKFDDMQAAHAQMREAHQKMRDAMKE